MSSLLVPSEAGASGNPEAPSVSLPGYQHLHRPLDGVVALTSGPCHAEKRRFAREEMLSCLELL